MAYLYHLVPKNLRGNTLYPLNTLKTVYPDICNDQARKYIGREHITKQIIPILDCLWNDVLHFSAVHPQEIKQALIEAGKKPDFLMEYYQIDLKLIDPKKTIVYLFAHVEEKDEMSEKNFVKYLPEKMAEYSKMPQITKDYYKETLSKGNWPLLYYRIPHILFKGTLDITSLTIVSV